MPEEKKKAYTLMEGAKHSVLKDDPARKRGTVRVVLGGGDTVELTAAGAHAMRDKLVEMQEKEPAKKKKEPAKKKAAAAAGSKK